MVPAPFAGSWARVPRTSGQEQAAYQPGSGAPLTLRTAAREALKAVGQLVDVCGGSGSLQGIRDLAAEMGVGNAGRNHDANPETTADILRSAGCTDIWTWTEHEEVRFTDRETLSGHLASAALAPYERGAELASAVASRLHEPVAEFVRLRVLARRR